MLTLANVILLPLPTTNSIRSLSSFIPLPPRLSPPRSHPTACLSLLEGGRRSSAGRAHDVHRADPLRHPHRSRGPRSGTTPGPRGRAAAVALRSTDESAHSPTLPRLVPPRRLPLRRALMRRLARTAGGPVFLTERVARNDEIIAADAQQLNAYNATQVPSHSSLAPIGPRDPPFRCLSPAAAG